MLRLPSRELVLVGAGHTNLHVLRKWVQHPLADVQLTVVSPTPSAPYSGMFPGTLAGLYQPGRMLIDLDQLSHAAGARLLLAECTGLDLAGRQVLLKDRPPVRFDLVSIGVGSRPAGMHVVQGHPGLISIKPMFTALQRLRQRCTELLQSERVEHRGPLSVVVVGGGAAGVEIAFCLQSFFRNEFPQLWQQGIRLTLIDRNDTVLKGYRSRTVALTQRLLQQRDIALCLNRSVTGFRQTELLLDDHTQVPADVLVWCAGAAPMPLLQQMDVSHSHDGFLRVHPTLQSVSDDRVFAVGDTADIEGLNVPRAGVFAVRQGPVLWQNIQKLFAGKPLVAFEPQRDFLSLLATGDGQAIGQYRGFTAHGRWVWKIKDHIDENFVAMHRPSGMDLDAEAQPLMPAGAASLMSPMRCRGCGGKTSARVLSAVLDRLRAETPDQDADFLVAEDCAILSAEHSFANAVSVDMFSALLEDPWLVGRIAAIHSLSDLYSRLVRPTVAVAHVILPSGNHAAQSELLYQLLSGVVQALRAAGVVLVGGHTMDGDELNIGLTVLGRTMQAAAGIARSPGKGGLQVGQQLVLTKAVGTGVILAGRERVARGTVRFGHLEAPLLSGADMVQSAVQSMLLSNEAAAAIAARCHVSGMTDITGFGVAGHVLEMLDASNVTARLLLSQIPLLHGAEQLLNSGVRSSLDAENRLAECRIAASEALRTTAAWSALFDPQTSGGLLLGVDPAHCQTLLQDLHTAGFHSACVIGEVTGPSEPRTEIPSASHPLICEA